MENPQRSEDVDYHPMKKLADFRLSAMFYVQGFLPTCHLEKKKKNTKAATNSGVASIQVAPTVLCKGR